MIRSFAEHPWRTVLKQIGKHFFEKVSPSTVAFNAFQADVTPRQRKDGRYIWGIYAIGGTFTTPWWRAEFVDDGVVTWNSMEEMEFIPYADAISVMCPNDKSVPPEDLIWMGHTVRFQRAEVLGAAGRRYEVYGGVDERGHREVYLWHAITAARFDRDRILCNVAEK